MDTIYYYHITPYHHRCRERRAGARALATAIGARWWMESRPSMGSCFYTFLVMLYGIARSHKRVTHRTPTKTGHEVIHVLGRARSVAGYGRTESLGMRCTWGR